MKINLIKPLNIIVNGNKLDKADHIIFLGVLIDKNCN